MTTTPINKIKSNPNNPRVIKDDKFKKLVQSLKDLPEMAQVRPIVVNQDMIVLGGNMRLKAMKEAGWKEAPVAVVDWDEDKQRQFIIKDNVGFGEWDWDMLANEWDAESLNQWGLDVPEIGEEDVTYTSKVESPIYEPKENKPEPEHLYDLKKYNALIDKISNCDLDDKTKLFLQMAATRHIEFNYAKIAEFYSHEDKHIQDLMEDSALVIIDYNKAIELGFVALFDGLQKLAEVDE